MPDVLDNTGLTTKDLNELNEDLEAKLKVVYGDDINVDQNSQDGQQINIYDQEAVDTREILQQVNAGFDPDQAFGRVLDQRIALNGMKRNGGTFTLTPVNITTDQALNLIGLDDQSPDLNPTVANLYTIKDDAGTEFYLLTSFSFVGAATESLTFRAAEIGDIEVQVNTITTAVTILAGITGINNPSGVLNEGEEEESDAKVKTRRRSSVALPALGYLDSIEAQLADLSGVSVARVYENDTNVTDGDGTPAHHIWAIVEGGDEDDIGAILYKKKSSGSGMRGAVTVDIPRPNGTTYPASFDRPGSQDLWIRFSLALVGGGVIDEDDIKRQIVENVIWEVGDEASSDVVTSFVKSLNSKYQITGMLLSDDDASYIEVVAPSSPQNRFVNDISRIDII